jgi:hypothetical protein
MTRHHRQLLQRLAAGEPRSPLAEMARDLLAGRTTPRSVIASGIYDEALGQGGAAAARWYATASPDDREAALSSGQDTVARLAVEERAGVPDEVPGNPAGTSIPGSPVEDEDFSELDPLRPE